VTRAALVALALAAAAGCGRLGYDSLDGDAAFGPPDAASGTPDADPLAPDAAPSPDASLPPDADPFVPDAGTCSTGCPTGIAFVDPTATSQVGGPGGTGFNDPCPTGQVLIGFNGGLSPPDRWIGQIQAECGIVTLTPGTLAITVTPGATLGLHGQTSNFPWSVQCPADAIVFGFDGRSGSFVDQLGFVCARLAVTGSPGSYAISYEAAFALPPQGGTGGLPFAAQRCQGGRVGTGIFGRSGLDLDALGVDCSLPQLIY